MTSFTLSIFCLNNADNVVGLLSIFLYDSDYLFLGDSYLVGNQMEIFLSSI